MHLPGLIEANVAIKQRDCDLAVPATDPLVAKGLGYAPAQPDAARKFIEAFHDPDWDRARPPRAQQKTFFPAPTDPLLGLGRAQAGWVQNIARAYAAQKRALTRATLDADTALSEANG